MRREVSHLTLETSGGLQGPPEASTGELIIREIP